VNRGTYAQLSPQHAPHVDADMGGSRSLDRRRSGASFRADAADAIHLAPG
jgi:hypothetical protein